LLSLDVANEDDDDDDLERLHAPPLSPHLSSL
jgi:hypothetical protein